MSGRRPQPSFWCHVGGTDATRLWVTRWSAVDWSVRQDSRFEGDALWDVQPVLFHPDNLWNEAILNCSHYWYVLADALHHWWHTYSDCKRSFNNEISQMLNMSKIIQINRQSVTIRTCRQNLKAHMSYRVVCLSLSIQVNRIAPQTPGTISHGSFYRPDGLMND